MTVDPFKPADCTCDLHQHLHALLQGTTRDPCAVHHPDDHAELQTQRAALERQRAADAALDRLLEAFGRPTLAARREAEAAAAAQAARQAELDAMDPIEATIRRLPRRLGTDHPNNTGIVALNSPTEAFARVLGMAVSRNTHDDGPDAA